MIKSKLTPCMDWVQKLSARHPDDLSLSDRLALNEHLASCQACTAVHAAYQMMEVGIRSLPVITSAPVLPSQRSQLAKKATPESNISLPGPIILLLSAFTSLFMMISWSSFFQMVHTWILIAIAHRPRQITYVNSNDVHTFAIRSESGFLVWTQKRYQKHNLYSTPLRWSGLGFMGVGISYVSALDFCRFTASA